MSIITSTKIVKGVDSGSGVQIRCIEMYFIIENLLYFRCSGRWIECMIIISMKLSIKIYISSDLGQRNFFHYITCRRNHDFNVIETFSMYQDCEIHGFLVRGLGPWVGPIRSHSKTVFIFSALEWLHLEESCHLTVLYKILVWKTVFAAPRSNT